MDGQQQHQVPIFGGNDDEDMEVRPVTPLGRLSRELHARQQQERQMRDDNDHLDEHAMHHRNFHAHHTAVHDSPLHASTRDSPLHASTHDSPLHSHHRYTLAFQPQHRANNGRGFRVVYDDNGNDVASGSNEYNEYDHIHESAASEHYGHQDAHDDADAFYGAHSGYARAPASSLISDGSRLRRGGALNLSSIGAGNGGNGGGSGARMSEGNLVLSDEMTVRDRQEAINQSHPFGARLWKPALYKKTRTIESMSYAALHETPVLVSNGVGGSSGPSSRVSLVERMSNFMMEWHLYPGNVLYFLLFGWWMAAVYALLSMAMLVSSLFTARGRLYASVVWEMAVYVLWPFGQFLERIQPTSTLAPVIYHENDATTARGTSDPTTATSTTFYAPLVVGEDSPLLGHDSSSVSSVSVWMRLRQLTFADIVYYGWFFLVIAPLQLFVSAVCWQLIVSIPMAKLNYVLLNHLFHEPLNLHFSGSSLAWLRRSRHRQTTGGGISGEILLCTYKAMSSQYWKYTYDGVNIFFINLMPVVAFALVDGYVLAPALHHTGIGHPMAIFILCLVSVTPLAYFIGMAVASISSQSSFGLGAVINASFGSIVEIILYWMAIIQGKGVLVEGAIIGSFLGTLLLLPGLSMVAGGVGRWKEQRFNVKSAGVSTVLLIMAMIGAFTPTLFYQTFGKHELYCDACPGLEPAANNDNNSAGGLSTALLRCTGCTYELPKNTGTDPFYISRTRPLMYICAAILPTAYLVGLWFTLRTHVRQIYAADNTKKTASMLLFASPPVSANTVPNALAGGDDGAPAQQGTPMRTPHQSAGESGSPAVLTPRTSAVPSTTRLSGHQPATRLGSPGQRQSPTHATPVPRRRAVASQDVLSEHGSDGGHGGHDAPEWSKWKSSVILLLSTVLFSLLAELLVDTVDEVIAQSGLDKKFIGLTLFALVPNVTEFMNAIAFAMNGNVALSLEIGSAYAVQVALIQIPFLVLFSGLWNHYWGVPDTIDKSFTLIFPRWDVLVVFLSIFLLSYTLLEGKSTYFRGTILVLAYTVLASSFYFV